MKQKLRLKLSNSLEHRKFKVTVYSLLMNYSYETVFAIGLKVYCWHKFQ